jgi:hypothetical protein
MVATYAQQTRTSILEALLFLARSAEEGGTATVRSRENESCNGGTRACSSVHLERLFCFRSSSFMAGLTSK